MTKKLKIEIEMDNDAFEEGFELPRIMKGLADYFNHELPDSFPIRDINGNKVGFVRFEDEGEG